MFSTTMLMDRYQNGRSGLCQAGNTTMSADVESAAEGNGKRGFLHGGQEDGSNLPEGLHDHTAEEVSVSQGSFRISKKQA